MYSAKTSPQEKKARAPRPANGKAIAYEKVSGAELAELDAASRDMRKGKYLTLKKAGSILAK